MLVNTFMDASIDLSNFADNAQKATSYNNLGNTTGNFTLDMSRINIGHVTGNHTVTLPTILDKSKQNICVFDFTTTNSAYPSITNTNIKKRNASIVYVANTGIAQSITGASNTSPIEITIATHGYMNGDTVLIDSVGGNTSANGTFTITVTGTNTFILNGSVGNADYTTGGTSSVYGVRNRLTCVSVNASDLWEVFIEQYGGSVIAFSQPTLSANGTLGGSSFAVAASSEFSGRPAYAGVDGTSACWTLTGVPGSYTWYNPTAILITNLAITNGIAGATADIIYGYTVEGSNDNSNWTSLASGTNGVTTNTTWNIPINTTNYYKYFRMSISSGSTGAPGFQESVISGYYIQNY